MSRNYLDKQKSRKSMLKGLLLCHITKSYDIEPTNQFQEV